MADTLPRSRIGYTNDAVPWYHGWNPIVGCSRGCEGCWARRIAKRLPCAQCRAFTPHLHPERLGQPARTKRPGVVLLGFMGDVGDSAIEAKHLMAVQANAVAARWHNYVWLTRYAGELGARLGWPLEDNWWLGTTITGDCVDSDHRLRELVNIPGKTWVSYEPAQAEWTPPTRLLARLSGVIVGHDNRRVAPGTDTLNNIRSIVRQCKDVGVKVYTKQAWLRTCPECLTTYGDDASIERCEMDHEHKARKLVWRLHHNGVGNPDFDNVAPWEGFPVEIGCRDLPWSMPRTHDAARVLDGRTHEDVPEGTATDGPGVLQRD